MTPARKTLEDPLAYLPCSHILEYSRGQLVYGPGQPSASIYLVIDGKVKVCRTSDEGKQVVVDIYQPDEFFGESAFLGQHEQNEHAIAIETTRVMTWPTAEIEDLATRRPQLAIALVQLLVKRSMDFGARIESFSVDNISRRLARALLRFTQRLGKKLDNGSYEMIPVTHEVLAQYVGTSREIITHYMNRFRRDGLLTYSRRGISLDRDRVVAWLATPASRETPLRESKGA